MVLMKTSLFFIKNALFNEIDFDSPVLISKWKTNRARWSTLSLSGSMTGGTR